MPALIRLCQTSGVQEGIPLRIEPEGVPPLAAFRIGDDFFVISDTCTHGKASLSEGTQEGGDIECPSHGGVFDIRTGEAKQFPCRIAIKTYAVVIDDGWICIEA